MSSSRGGKHVAEGGAPLDMDHLSTGYGHVLITMGSWLEEAAHFIKDAAETSARNPGTRDFP